MDRLNPKKNQRNYWVLKSLADTINMIIQEDIVDVKQNSIVLDYGCGNSPYRPLFESAGYKYIGADVVDNEYADIKLNDNGEIPLATGSVGLILSSQVLEHVPSPQNYLNEANRVLSDKGILIISTHGIWPYHPDPCDYWRWTSDGIKKIITESGFTIIKMIGILSLLATSIQLGQDATLQKVFYRIRPIYIRFMQFLIELSDKCATDIQKEKEAAVFVIVARKNNANIQSD